MIDVLIDVRAKNGRIFILGVGGGAGHVVNDFRKICGIEALCPDGYRVRVHGVR